MQNNPQVVFERLFGDGNTADAAQGAARSSRSACSTRCRRGRRRCSGSCRRRDRTRLDQYLTDVREIERRIQKAGEQLSDDLRHPERADRRARGRRGAHQADVRPAGAGLAGGHHARLDVPDVQGAEQRRLSEERHPRRVPHPVAPLERAGEHRPLRGAEHVPRARCSPTSWTSCRRRPTATARCSITRWCSTAAA